MRSHETRLQKLAQRLQCCPVHGERLHCARRYVWTGTREEFDELMPLSDRLDPYIMHLQPTAVTCAHCGERLWCSQCYESITKRVVVPDDLMTEAEQARYCELLAFVQERPEHPGSHEEWIRSLRRSLNREGGPG